ncbi:MAG: hypothetical protein JWM48_1260 [Mycobacterium sp.]|jgi:hypothetical protein|nr:hypothetical protein [Mycobacterium sp.]MCW2744710.1 hypothetical protein [Mycobacterium sp.]
MPASPFVVDTAGDFDPEAVFTSGRDQIVVAVKIRDSHLDLGLLAAVVDEGNARGFALVREQVLGEQHLLIVFDAYDETDED